jgi:lipoprotein-anchoring transpeptidase ErfK/SrfK
MVGMSLPNPATPPTARRARGAAVLAGLLLLAGCGGGAGSGGPEQVPVPVPAVPAQPAAPARPAAGPVDLGGGPGYAALATRDVTVLSKPGKGDVVGLFQAKLVWGNPTPFLVRAAHRDAAGRIWLKVLLPQEPNGSTGWVRRDQVRLTRVDRRAEVDLSARTLRLYRGDRVERMLRVAVGAPGTPTPTGEFFITVKLRPPQVSPVYGAFALGLSAYSEVLDQFGTGDGQIALHGTANRFDLGRAVSHGCVRLANPAITQLAEVLPVGSPVTIKE